MRQSNHQRIDRYHNVELQVVLESLGYPLWNELQNPDNSKFFGEIGKSIWRKEGTDWDTTDNEFFTPIKGYIHPFIGVFDQLVILYTYYHVGPWMVIY
jgi:hypothetical protein